MTARISDDYMQQQKQLHQNKGKNEYGIMGHIYADGIVQLAMVTGSQASILDYGCGKQTLKNAMPQFRVDGYDPCIEGLDAEPEPHDLVVCTDVLEHIEPEYLDDVLDHIAELTRKAVFLSISTRLAKKTLPDGRNAHLIVQPYQWWMPKLWERFTIGTMQNIDNQTLIVTGVPNDV